MILNMFRAACRLKHVEEHGVTYVLLKNKGIVHYVGYLKKSTHILSDIYNSMHRQNQTSGTDRYGHCTGMSIHRYNLNFCTKILVVLSHFLHTHKTDNIQPTRCMQDHITNTTSKMQDPHITHSLSSKIYIVGYIFKSTCHLSANLTCM